MAESSGDQPIVGRRGSVRTKGVLEVSEGHDCLCVWGGGGVPRV